MPDLIFLSNNHIKDYGIDEIENTIKLLKQNNIEYIGILENNQMESKAYYIKNNIKVGIYNICEIEFSIATENPKGANSLDGIKKYEEIKQIKEK